MKRLLTTVLLSMVSSFVSAQTLTPGSGASGTNGRGQAEHAKPEPPAAAGKSAQSWSPAEQKVNKPLDVEIDKLMIDKLMNELPSPVIPFIQPPGAAAPTLPPSWWAPGI